MLKNKFFLLFIIFLFDLTLSTILNNNQKSDFISFGSKYTSFMALGDKYLFSGTGKNINIWSATNGKYIKNLLLELDDDNEITAGEVLPNGNIAVAVSLNIEVYNPNTGKRGKDFRAGKKNEMTCCQLYTMITATSSILRVLSDGTLASGMDDNSIHIFNTIDGSLILKIPNAHTATINDLLQLPLTGYLVSAATSIYDQDQDFDVKVWDLFSSSYETPLHILKGHTGGVTCLSLLKNNSFASGSSDNTIIIWSTKTWKSIGQYTSKYAYQLYNQFLSLITLRSGDLLSVDYKGNIVRWDVSKGNHSLLTTTGTGFSKMVKLKNGNIAVGGRNGIVTILRI